MSETPPTKVLWPKWISLNLLQYALILMLFSLIGMRTGCGITIPDQLDTMKELVKHKEQFTIQVNEYWHGQPVAIQTVGGPFLNIGLARSYFDYYIRTNFITEDSYGALDSIRVMLVADNPEFCTTMQDTVLHTPTDTCACHLK